MKAGLIYATLLIIAVGAMGCGAVPEPPLACTQEEFAVGNHEDFTFEYCQALGMECNEAVTAASECPGFVVELEAYIREVILPMMSDESSFLPPFIDAEELVAMLFDEYVGVCGEVESLGEVGTCQFPGDLEAPCAEDADCLGDLVCLEGMCLVRPEEPECLEDADCPDPDACHVGVCGPLTGACQSTPVSCDDSNVCTDDFCHPDVGCSSEPTITPPEAEETTCDDGVDNDCDGAVDSEDIDCIWCGNGIVEGDEECDDGNTVSGDGCSADCLEEA